MSEAEAFEAITEEFAPSRDVLWDLVMQCSSERDPHKECVLVEFYPDGTPVFKRKTTTFKHDAKKCPG